MEFAEAALVNLLRHRLATKAASSACEAIFQGRFQARRRQTGNPSAAANTPICDMPKMPGDKKGHFGDIGPGQDLEGPNMAGDKKGHSGTLGLSRGPMEVHVPEEVCYWRGTFGDIAFPYHVK